MPWDLKTLEEAGKAAAAFAAIIGLVLLVWFRLHVFVIWDWVRKHRAADLRDKRIAEMAEVFRTLWTEERHALRSAIVSDNQATLDFALKERVYPKLDEIRDRVSATNARIDEHMVREEAATVEAAELAQASAANTAGAIDRLVGRFDETEARIERLELERPTQ